MNLIMKMLMAGGEIDMDIVAIVEVEVAVDPEMLTIMNLMRTILVEKQNIAVVRAHTLPANEVVLACDESKTRITTTTT